MVHACCGAAAGVARSGMAWVAQGWMAGAGELVFLGRGGWGGVLGVRGDWSGVVGVGLWGWGG